MDEKEALQVVIANAACQLVGGCDMCPYYDTEKSARVLQRKCQEALSIERVRAAVTTLRGYVKE